MNWRWKRIIICAIIGLIFGIITAINAGNQTEGFSMWTQIAIISVMPISINFLYWGWIKASELLSKLNIFLVMSLGKWIVFFFIRFMLSALIGYIMFPIAIFKAIKNED